MSLLSPTLLLLQLHVGLGLDEANTLGMSFILGDLGACVVELGG